MQGQDAVESSSFRDPSGFLFSRDGILYRQVNRRYRSDYDLLKESGLYRELTGAGELIRHEEVSPSLGMTADAYRIIRPEQLPFVSYPYEWCFSELKDAALLTLKIQKKALQHGMSLKDASAFNVQFSRGRPVFIDTLSFERYREGEPWIAYRQFCQHFLAPLALMRYRDHRFNQWFRVNIDGIPLDLASRLLPVRTKLMPRMLVHIHLHAWSQKRFAGRTVSGKGKRFSRLSFLALVDSLENAVSSLKWPQEKTEWSEYYSETNYTENALAHKKRLVSEFIDIIRPGLVWDIGANQGLFSRIASGKGIQTVSFDIDHACVERNYTEVKKNNEQNILPLLLDATNPSPDIGWHNRERRSLIHRGPAQCLLALALVHHLAISNNVPLERIAAFFSEISDSLIIEWIPKEDSQVQRLLATREDIFDGYTQECFEKGFGQHFEIVRSSKINESRRSLYLMKTVRRGGP